MVRAKEIDQTLQSINLNRLNHFYRDILNEMVFLTGLTKRDLVRLSIVLLADRWGLESVNLRRLKTVTDKLSPKVLDRDHAGHSAEDSQGGV